MRGRHLLLAAMGCTAAGCLYVSDYTPLRDGRARVVWRDNRPRAVLGGSPLTEECAQAVAALARVKDVHFLGIQAGDTTLTRFADEVSPAMDDFFSSRVFIHLPRPGKRPFAPTLYLIKREKIHVFDYRLLGRAAEPMWPRDWLTSSGLLFNFVFAAGHSSGRSVLDDDEIGVGLTMAYWFLTLSSGIPVWSSLLPVTPQFRGRPSADIAYAAGLVHAYNDLARARDTPCSYPELGGSKSP